MADDDAPMDGRAPAGTPPDVLDALRRSLRVRVSAGGRISMRGEPVTHPRVRQVVLAGLDRTDDGALCFRLGSMWAYVEAEDLPLRVTTVSVEDGHARLRVRLDDGRRLSVPATALFEDRRGLAVTVPSAPSGRPLAARVTNRAAMELAEHLELGDDGPVLRLGSRVVRIRPADETSPSKAEADP